jgi:DNA-binding response OmpR family regulator
MITKRFFETAEVLIYDPVAENRNATRASLHSLGFRKVESTPTISALSQRLRSTPPDLLLAEISGGEQEICPLIQSVRRGELGDNPFIVTLATTWRRDGSIITQAVNSGADDLVARPVSTSVLGERIRLLADRRKGFVVTSDYIGPDRRRAARPGDAQCMEVPNPLKFRALDTATDEEIVRQIFESVAVGKAKLNLEKLRRDAVQLCLQWRMLERRRPGAADFGEILSRIGRLASEMNTRAVRVQQHSVPQWCEIITQSVGTLMEMTRGAADASKTIDCKGPLGMLGHAALTLGRMFAPAEVEPDRLVELDDLVSRRVARSAAA